MTRSLGDDVGQVAHLDRSDKVKAAAAMKWVVVENLLLSRADALVVSSGAPPPSTNIADLTTYAISFPT